MKAICFDTNIFVWSVQGSTTPDPTGNISKAKYLIRQCQESNTPIIIPSIVLSELFMDLPIEKHREFYLQISRLGLIVPYDTRASFEYGKLSRLRWPLKAEMGIARAKMKIDMMIIASALANKATCIYSEDDDISKLGGDFIEVRKLPSINIQTELDLKNQT